MRILLQRVSSARVRSGGAELGAVGQGYCLFLGITDSDTTTESAWLADKVAGLRLFPDDDGKMNRSLTDVGGACLIVSQFTLYGDTTRGRRPSFVRAARPEQAEPLYEHFVNQVRQSGIAVATGRFGAMMEVELVNDGPVTLLIERHGE